MKKEYIVRGAVIMLAAIIFLFAAVIIVSAAYQVIDMEDVATIIAPTEQSNLFNLDFDYMPQNTSIKCTEEIAKCNEYIKYLNTLEETPERQEEIKRVQSIIYTHECDFELLYNAELEQAKWDARRIEYPIATEVWLYMREEFGWNDEVCAGIMGNMMAEIAGGTLDFWHWDANGSSGYGMIQWIGSRRKGIEIRYGKEPSVKEQLLYMRDEMFGTNGVKQQISNSQLTAIMEGKTPEQIAYDFARYFERCASYSYERRCGYARIAYEYFAD